MGEIVGILVVLLPVAAMVGSLLQQSDAEAAYSAVVGVRFVSDPLKLLHVYGRDRTRLRSSLRGPISRWRNFWTKYELVLLFSTGVARLQ